MKKRLFNFELPLYKAACAAALGAALLWPVALILQGAFLADLMDRSLIEGQAFSETLHLLFDRVTETDMPLVYDLPHMAGIPVLIPLLILFARICFWAKSRPVAKRKSCILMGIGLECYAVLGFLSNLIFAAALYHREWSMGVSHSVIFRILFTAFGSGVAELSMISLFAASLLITGYTGAVRPLAVSTGAICFYRLFEDSLWLLTGIFDGTLSSAPFLQVAHDLIFLAAFSLTFGAAVLVAMSSSEKQREEVAVCS